MIADPTFDYGITSCVRDQIYPRKTTSPSKKREISLVFPAAAADCDVSVCSPRAKKLITVMERMKTSFIEDNVSCFPLVNSPPKPIEIRKKVDTWPEDIEDVLRDLSLKDQGSICQMENFMKQPKSLHDISLPRSVGQYTCMKRDKKKVNIPRWIRIDNVRYGYEKHDEVFVGGFSFVVFYSRSKGKKNDINHSLPDKVALKVTKVNFEDFEKFVLSGFDSTRTSIGWIRELKVHNRLMKKFKTKDKPVIDLFSSAVFKVGQSRKSIQVYTVLAAGHQDFHKFFLEAPMTFNICHTYDFERRERYLGLLSSAARNLQRLHDVGLHHGDVKLSNILVVKEEENERAVFTDFDGSVFLDEGIECDTYTREYISPQRKVEDGIYSPFKDDCWAFGICMLKIVTRKSNPMRHLDIKSIKDYNLVDYVRMQLSRSVLPMYTRMALQESVLGLLRIKEEDRLAVGEVAEKLSKLYED